MEGCLSGLKEQSWKLSYGNVPWVRISHLPPDFGKLAEGLRQRFAKPSFRNGCNGSNPLLSASFNVAPSVMIAHLSVKQVERVWFPGSTQVMPWVARKDRLNPTPAAPSSRWCNGSTRHSKRLGGSSILSRDAIIVVKRHIVYYNSQYTTFLYIMVNIIVNIRHNGVSASGMSLALGARIRKFDSFYSDQLLFWYNITKKLLDKLINV